MKKEITVAEFITELLDRIDTAKDINCCKAEIKVFADYVKEKIGEDKIEIEWKE